MIPVLAAADFMGPGPAQPAAAAALHSALVEAGGVHLLLPEPLREVPRRALEAARGFFDQPEAAKARLAIEASPHHRGWSVMHNERDWREQVHLGRDRPVAAGDGPEWRRLEGPNPWPPDLGEGFRGPLEAHLETCGALGHGLAGALASVSGFGEECYEREDAYLLMKLIAYHPQPPGAPPRRGVAAHVDFSLLTLLAQDARGGLEIRDRRGRWLAVEPREDALFLNTGEILEALSGGRLVATPHRVTHRGTEGCRLSIPVFINPPLRAWIHPAAGSIPAGTGEGHVHRILTGHEGSFRFGEAEWRRKGLNRWCTACCG